MYTVYVLRSGKDGNFYIGCTSNLEERIKSHMGGRVLSTKSRLPLSLIYSKSYDSKYEAFHMERFYKTAGGKRVLRKRLVNWGIV